MSYQKHKYQGTSTERASSSKRYFNRAENIPGFLVINILKIFKFKKKISNKYIIQLDGMNVFHVKEAIKFSKKWAIQNGPIIIEADTYRYHVLFNFFLHI